MPVPLSTRPRTTQPSAERYSSVPLVVPVISTRPAACVGPSIVRGAVTCGRPGVRIDGTPSPGIANVMVSAAGVAFASWIAARSEQSPLRSAQTPLPAAASERSVATSTTKVARTAGAYTESEPSDSRMTSPEADSPRTRIERVAAASAVRPSTRRGENASDAASSSSRVSASARFHERRAFSRKSRRPSCPIRATLRRGESEKFPRAMEVAATGSATDASAAEAAPDELWKITALPPPVPSAPFIVATTSGRPSRKPTSPDVSAVRAPGTARTSGSPKPPLPSPRRNRIDSPPDAAAARSACPSASKSPAKRKSGGADRASTRSVDRNGSCDEPSGFPSLPRFRTVGVESIDVAPVEHHDAAVLRGEARGEVGDAIAVEVGRGER